MPFRTHKKSGLQPLRTRGFLQPIMGTLGKSLSFHFTGATMVSDLALLRLHRDLVKMQAADFWPRWRHR